MTQWKALDLCNVHTPAAARATSSSHGTLTHARDLGNVIRQARADAKTIQRMGRPQRLSHLTDGAASPQLSARPDPFPPAAEVLPAGAAKLAVGGAAAPKTSKA